MLSDEVWLEERPAYLRVVLTTVETTVTRDQVANLFCDLGPNQERLHAPAQSLLQTVNEPLLVAWQAGKLNGTICSQSQTVAL